MPPSRMYATAENRFHGCNVTWVLGVPSKVAEAPGSKTVAGEEGCGGELVRPLELVSVVSPLLQERAEQHCEPLGIDLLIPKSDILWGSDAVPGEAIDIADPEGQHSDTHHGEEGCCPRLVASAAPQPLKVLPRVPHLGLGEVRNAFVDGLYLQPHPRGNHLRE